MSPNLTPRLLRSLHVQPAKHPRGQPHLSATSGLVMLPSEGNLHGYLVADDEHHLGHFVLGSNAPVELLRILPGDLPDDIKKRKKAKPDLECLAHLPAMPGYPQGALLALGSGSREQRHTGLLMPLSEDGLLSRDIKSSSKLIDLNALYAPLHEAFEDLNIEGCIIQGKHLYLLQRGNKGASGSACIQFDTAQFLTWLLSSTNGTPATPSAPAAPSVRKTISIHLGEVDGIPLTPTDGIALPDGRWLISAAAENTDNSFADGPCAGSALALLNSKGELQTLHLLQGAPKIEGIALCDASQQGDPLSVLMVTDADDPELASQLLSVDAFW